MRSLSPEAPVRPSPTLLAPPISMNPQRLAKTSAVLLVLLLAPLPAMAYPEWIAPQRASEAAGQRGDWASACRHAINAAFAMNQYNQFNSAYMEYVGKTCSRAGRSG